MEIIHQFLFEHPYLSVLQTLFTVWMLIDAYRRGVQSWWFYVIFLFQPLGAWVYFFAEKWGHWEGVRGLSGMFKRKTPLAELEFRARQSPTLANYLALGERLVELRRHEDAITPLEQARMLEPTHAPICFLLARCHYETAKSAVAFDLLRRIIDAEPRWEDYSAWKQMILVQQDLKQDDGVLETARQLVKLSPRMEHKFLLADQLARLRQDGEARLVLENALQEQQFVAAPVRRMNGEWIKQAKRLLSELSPK